MLNAGKGLESPLLVATAISSTPMNTKLKVLFLSIGRQKWGAIQCWRMKNPESPATQAIRGIFKWSGAELNRRHADFQSAALPTELPDQCGAKSLICFVRSFLNMPVIDTQNRSSDVTSWPSLTSLVRGPSPRLSDPVNQPTNERTRNRPWSVQVNLAHYSILYSSVARTTSSRRRDADSCPNVLVSTTRRLPDRGYLRKTAL